jgi:uncharacterized phage protein (TIGR01671 family)
MEQRKIAFRAWDKIKNEMYYKVLVGNTDGNDENYTCNSILKKDTGEWMNADHFCIDLMQFTGKKDCNGKDVYEGDIVEFDRQEWGGDDNIHIVSWNERDAEWSFGGGSASDMEWRTVIGNIYENPELISERS